MEKGERQDPHVRTSSRGRKLRAVRVQAASDAGDILAGGGDAMEGSERWLRSRVRVELKTRGR
jgi:hypothetical protein